MTFAEGVEFGVHLISLTITGSLILSSSNSSDAEESAVDESKGSPLPLAIGSF